MLLHQGISVFVVMVWFGIITTVAGGSVRLECTKGCSPSSAGVTGYKGESITLKVVVSDSICVLEIKYADNLIVHTYEPNLCRLDIRPVPKYDDRLVFDHYLRRDGNFFVYEFTLTNLKLQDTGKKFVYSTDLKDDQGNIVEGSETVTVLATTPPPEPTTTAETTQTPPPPVDGNWGQWLTAACSVTCGTGLTTRYRKCDDPPPQNGGQTCQGPGSESAFCQRPTCPAPPTTTAVTTTLPPTTTTTATTPVTTTTPKTTTTIETTAKKVTTQALSTSSETSTRGRPAGIVEETTKSPSTKPDTKEATSSGGITTTTAKVVKVSTVAPLPDDSDRSTKKSASPGNTAAPSTPLYVSKGGDADSDTKTGTGSPAPSPNVTVSSTEGGVVVEMQRGGGEEESSGTITAIVIVLIGLVAIVIVVLIVRRNKRERLRKYDTLLYSGGGDDEEKLQPIHEEKCDSSTTDTCGQAPKTNPAYPLDEDFLEREGIVKC